jgi:hypothetical protein
MKTQNTEETQNTEPLSPEEEDVLWGRVQKANREYDRKRRIRNSILSSGIAVSVAILAVTGWYAGFQTHDTPDYSTVMDAYPRNDTSSTDVQLLISDERELSLRGKFIEIDYRREGNIVVNGEELEVRHQVAEEPKYNRLTTPFGKRSSLILADGTKMWVNSNTRVVYPVNFADDRREIFVEGEVFLDVARNERTPFFVRTQDMEVQVLGTSFNVLATGDGSASEVVLVSGNVEVHTGGDKTDLLSPGRMFSYDALTDRREIREVDTSDYVAWKEGYYRFDSQPLDVILRRIEKFYGTPMEWDPGVTRLKCSGKLDFERDLNAALGIVEKAAPVEFRMENDKIYVNVKP